MSDNPGATSPADEVEQNNPENEPMETSEAEEQAQETTLEAAVDEVPAEDDPAIDEAADTDENAAEAVAEDASADAAEDEADEENGPDASSADDDADDGSEDDDDAQPDSVEAEEAQATEAPQPSGPRFKRVDGPLDENAPYQVPDLPPYFVPREEVLAIKDLLLSRPMASLAPLTLHGPTGAGKTSVALALAHDADMLEAYPDGVFWYSLGEDGDVQHAQAVWAEAMGFDISHLPETSGRAAALRTLLRDAKALLIIDDVTDIDQVKALNVGGPNCVRLITTDMVEEIGYGFKTRRYAVTRMREKEALDLLTEWAGILPDIYLPTVEEIVERLMYAPLALSLVGAQARQGITWLRLLEVLRDDQGPMATLDPEDDETRQQAIGLVLNLVLSRFGGSQVSRAQLLGAFAPGTSNPFSVGAAAACWEMEHGEALETLETLVGAALVQGLPGNLYAVHSALSDHLKESARPGVLDEAAKNVREYYLALVETSESAGDNIDRQIGQVMAAYRWFEVHDPERGGEFAAALMTTFEARGLWNNFAVLAERVVEKTREEGDIESEDEYLSDLGFAYSKMGRLDRALECFERTLTIAREIGDPAAEATALNNVGAIYERMGDFATAREHYEESLALRERLGVPEDIAEALNNMAGVLYWQERWGDALNTFQRVLDMYTMLENREKQAQTWLNVGATYENMNLDSEAQQAYQRSLAIYTNLGHDSGQSQALNNLGVSYFQLGDTERALANFKRSLALKEKLGDRSGEASTLNNIALLYEKTGSRSLALEYYERSFYILDSMEDPRAEVVEENIEQLRDQL